MFEIKYYEYNNHIHQKSYHDYPRPKLPNKNILKKQKNNNNNNNNKKNTMMTWT